MHYANGREAKVGDMVVGRGYNDERKLAGTLVSVTPGIDNCSALVEYITALPLEEVQAGKEPRMNARAVPTYAMRSENHGAAGAEFVHFVCRDYTHCGYLLHVEDALKGLALVEGETSAPATPRAA